MYINIYFAIFRHVYVHRGMPRKSKIKSWQLYVYKKQRNWQSRLLVMCPSWTAQVQSARSNHQRDTVATKGYC